MKKLHENCGGKLIKWGGRRRRCARCGKTVTKWSRQRGRRRKRTTPTLMVKYLREDISSFAAVARARGSSADAIERTAARSRKKFLEDRDAPRVPPRGPLIAVADAMMVRSEKRIFSVYLILLRGVSAKKAVITMPYITEGKESCEGWREAFAALPPNMLRRIVALVCDGHRGLYSVALRHNWLIQFCIFHFIAKLQGRRSPGAYGRHRHEGNLLLRFARTALTSTDHAEVAIAIKELEVLRLRTNSPQLKRYLSGFIRHHHLYRTYLQHPELNIPRTSNATESLIRIIRRLLSRAYGFRTIRSLAGWIQALVKTRKTIACNGGIPTELMR